MTTMRLRATGALLALAAISLVACGGSSKSSGEANSAATGDIPDNQTFLVFHDTAAGYSIKYPEGWARTGTGRDVSFRDKDNGVHVVVRRHAPQRTGRGATNVTLKAGRAVKATYTTLSPPDPVTGKRVKLTVDRYVVVRGGRVATIDLGTPVGVDNVDAYRLIAQSFHWG